MPLVKNDVIPLVITALSNDGSGVGRAPDGLAVFVPFTAVGDALTVKIVKVCKSYAFGIVQRIETPSPDRVAPACPLFGKCGGCCFAHLSYEAELRAKQSFAADAMRRIGGIDTPVEPILPSPQSERYRNKVQYPLTQDADGTVRAGFFAPRSHRVLPCADCLLQPVLLNDITRRACALLTQYRVPVYSEETHRGLVRHLYLRHAVTTGRVLLCFVLNGTALPHGKDICAALVREFPAIETIVLNVNTARTNVVTGEACVPLFGGGLLHDTLSGVPVSLSPLSFYQVNTEGANRLYAAAARLAALQPQETLLDLYCGAGTIGLSMAAQCKKLIGVEIVPDAVESARRSAAAMGVQHAEFVCADAGETAQRLAGAHLAPDCIVLDPPRKGCDDAALQAVARMAPPRIVMVSCNPATAARDAAALVRLGYAVRTVQPVDMFPRTKHVETVVQLSRKKPDDVIEIDLNLDELDATSAETKATYEEIKEYVLKETGLKVSSLYISQVKRKCGLEVGESYNLPKSEKVSVPQCPKDKEDAIRAALKHFAMI